VTNTPITTPWFVLSWMLAPFSANILPSVHAIQRGRLRAVLDRAKLIHALNRMNRKLKRFPPDLNRRDSQRVKDERIFVH
jgi:hypothetical protein